HALVPPQQVVGGEVCVHEPGVGHSPDVRDDLVERGGELTRREAGGDETRGGLLRVADELHEAAVVEELDGVGDVDAGVPEPSEHLVLVTDPAAVQQRLASGGHPFDRPLVTGSPEPPALVVDGVVDEGAGAGEPRRLELALVGDGDRAIALVGEEAGRAIVERTPLDDEDLGFLAGLQEADGSVDDLARREPWGQRPRRGRVVWDHGGAPEWCADGWVRLLRRGERVGAAGSGRAEPESVRADHGHRRLLHTRLETEASRCSAGPNPTTVPRPRGRGKRIREGWIRCPGSAR